MSHCFFFHIKSISSHIPSAKTIPHTKHSGRLDRNATLLQIYIHHIHAFSSTKSLPSESVYPMTSSKLSKSPSHSLLVFHLNPFPASIYRIAQKWPAYPRTGIITTTSSESQSQPPNSSPII